MGRCREGRGRLHDHGCCYTWISHSWAGVVKLADAPDSKSGDRKVMGVRFPPPAPIPRCARSWCRRLDSVFSAIALRARPSRAIPFRTSCARSWCRRLDSVFSTVGLRPRPSRAIPPRLAHVAGESSAFNVLTRPQSAIVASARMMATNAPSEMPHSTMSMRKAFEGSMRSLRHQLP